MCFRISHGNKNLTNIDIKQSNNCKVLDADKNVSIDVVRLPAAGLNSPWRVWTEEDLGVNVIRVRTRYLSMNLTLEHRNMDDIIPSLYINLSLEHHTLDQPHSISSKYG